MQKVQEYSDTLNHKRCPEHQHTLKGSKHPTNCPALDPFNLKQKTIDASKKYDGTPTPPECGPNVPLKTTDHHIFKPDIFCDANGGTTFTGMHHDYNGVLEKSGILKVRNVIEYANGFYKADISINGSTFRRCSFFPKSWSQSKVMEKIMEAYDARIDVSLSNSNNYLIVGEIIEGITIELYIEKLASGFAKLKTGYPALE